MIAKFKDAVLRAGRRARKASRIRGFASVLNGTPLRIKSDYGPELAIRFGDATFGACAFGGYGTFTADIIARQKQPFLFMDIGANIGIYSLLAAQNAQCSAVMSFEPIAETFAHLVNNIKINRMDNIFPFCGALTEQNGPSVLEMSFDADHSGVSRILSSSASNSRLAIPLTSSFLDGLLANWQDVRIIAKIDVEGAEESVLNALFSSAIQGRLSEVIIEISSLTRDGAEPGITRILENHGFREIGRRGSPEHYDAHFVRN